ncbi:hypothetical protein [Nocardia blacklockiae]|uniref:hypothetical protein n=1 Tax=Nocardia blacklockiae TaxID=480036 RepID=UPI001895FA27|nr:hypothetical protein [Nocardia blacklockiae]MBF6174718.1 hypothetical protein [Nocardia blacklockiae]
MNEIAYIASNRVAAKAIPSVPASRGVLALQGTGLSAVGILGARVQAPKHAIDTGKPTGSWHPAFADAFANAFANAYAADHLDGMPAARLRRTHPATVIRSRHRSRLR